MKSCAVSHLIAFAHCNSLTFESYYVFATLINWSAGSAFASLLHRGVDHSRPVILGESPTFSIRRLPAAFRTAPFISSRAEPCSMDRFSAGFCRS